MPATVTKPAPDFSAMAVIEGQFKQISLSEYRGKYVVLFFYPLDFTFVCPTEILSFSDKLDEFTKRNAVVLGVSVDSHYTHLAWINTKREEGGISGLRFPLVADLTKKIGTDYGVLTDDGFALRGTFLIDKDGVVRHASINFPPLGRNVDEFVRLLDALQHFEQHGEVCPANWTPGGATIKPNVAGSKEYFQSANPKK